MAFVQKSDLPFLGFVGATLGLRLLPKSLRFSQARRLAAGLGTAWRLADRSDVALARKNLQGALGDRWPAARLEACLPALYQHTALYKLMTDLLPTLTLDELDQFLSVEGEEHLQQALAGGRGVVFLGAHFGFPGYLSLQALKLRGYDMAAVLGEEITPDASWLYRHVIFPVRRSSRRLFQIINPDGVPQREIVESLRRNQVLMIMGDTLDDELRLLRPPHVLPAPLLGHIVPLKTGSFRLARWLGAPIVPWFTRPCPDGSFRVVIEAPLPVSADHSADGLMTDVATFTQRLEPYLLAYPELWMHWRHTDLLELMRPSAEARPGPASVYRPPVQARAATHG